MGIKDTITKMTVSAVAIFLKGHHLKVAKNSIYLKNNVLFFVAKDGNYMIC